MPILFFFFSGPFVVNGTGTITLGAVQVSGTGTVLTPITGTGAITLGAVQVSGAGAVLGPSTWIAPMGNLEESYSNMGEC